MRTLQRHSVPLKWTKQKPEYTETVDRFKVVQSSSASESDTESESSSESGSILESECEYNSKSDADSEYEYESKSESDEMPLRIKKETAQSRKRPREDSSSVECKKRPIKKPRLMKSESAAPAWSCPCDIVEDEEPLLEKREDLLPAPKSSFDGIEIVVAQVVTSEFVHQWQWETIEPQVQPQFHFGIFHGTNPR